MRFAVIVALFVACAALYAAEAKPVEVPLSNPGFETGAEGCSLNEARFPGLIALDKDHKHSGAASLRISDPRGTSDPVWTGGGP